MDAVHGDDSSDGKTAETAFRSIQRASDLAMPGTAIHIQPGVYREAVTPAQSGSDAEPIRYVAEGGPGSVFIRGSQPSSALTWVQLTSNSIGLPPGVDPTQIYYADLSSWGLKSAPRFVVELDEAGNPAVRLPLAREPDWPVVTDWKFHEFWWAADGGSEEAGCNPPLDADPVECDASSRSLTQLIDRHDDQEPRGIEPGNLTTLGNLTGASLVVLDDATGTFIFRRTITDHDVAAGRITVNEKCEDGYGTDQPALGWGSKYYVEGLPGLLDSPGEWWFDPNTGYLYLWPRVLGNPGDMKIEISRLEDGFNLQNRSSIILDSLVIEYFNRNAVSVENQSNDRSHADTIWNTTIRYAKNGVWLSQYVDPEVPEDRSIDGFAIEDSEIAFMDVEAFRIFYTWSGNSSAAAFTRPGVQNTVIFHNQFHHLGFRPDVEDGVGALIMYPDHLRFEQNHVYNVAHVGVQFKRSVIQSTKEYGFTPAAFKTSDILIRDNLFEKTCQNHTDCGALKITGTPPDRQVFRDLLVTGNIFRDTFGWTYIAEKRGHFSGGSASEERGMGGFGFYVDNASGIYAYRNIAYNNAFAGFKLAGTWRDGDIVYANNTVANSLYGFHFGGWRYDTHGGSVNTQIINNILLNHESSAIFLSDADGTFENTTVDYNLYYRNGWRPSNEGGEWTAGNIALTIPNAGLDYQTLSDIQSATHWEKHGVEGYPGFWDYDVNDHDPFDNSWPDFHLSIASSIAVDRGTAALPEALTGMLEKFDIPDAYEGSSFDIGRYEAGFAIRPGRIVIGFESEPEQNGFRGSWSNLSNSAWVRNLER